jgi:hypothetical protein
MKHVAIVESRCRTDRETVDRLVARLPKGTVIVSCGCAAPLSTKVALGSARKLTVTATRTSGSPGRLRASRCWREGSGGLTLRKVETFA